MSSPYDEIAELYDPWSASVVEDVAFYLQEARRSGGPVVELGVGTGRIAVPIAAEGIRVIGVDSSRGMLEVCARRAALAGVDVDLRLGDLRDPPVRERVPLVICPFRSMLHMQTDADRRGALASIRRLLRPGGRFAFDVFTPGAEDIAQTHDRWLEREPGIFELARWNEKARTLTLTVRGRESETTMSLSWLPPDEWRALLEDGGFEVEACYGWFDRTPFTGGEDTVWIARRTAGARRSGYDRSNCWGQTPCGGQTPTPPQRCLTPDRSNCWCLTPAGSGTCLSSALVQGNRARHRDVQ